MQAIITKYLGPTDTKPSRIKASCPAGSIIISYSYDHNEEGCHRQAAEALMEKLGWNTEHYGKFATGGIPDGYCHVFIKGY